MSAEPKATGEDPEGARPRVQSAARAVAILLAVANSDTGLTAREISEQVEISRQTAYHLLHTLVGCGVLARADSGRYVFGLLAGTLADGFRRQLSPAEHLGTLVRRIALATDETAYAAGWWAGAPTTLHVAQGRSTVQAAAVPQGTVPTRTRARPASCCSRTPIPRCAPDTWRCIRCAD